MKLFGDVDSEENDPYKSMFGPKMGTWTVSSKLDHRWNSCGTGYGLVSSGSGEAQNWIAECDRKFGKRPDDLSMSFFKD